MTADLVIEATGETVQQLTTSEAAELTEMIRLDLIDFVDAHERVMPKIRKALTQMAWDALGYASAGAYVAAEFGGTLQRLGVDARRGVVLELSAAGMSTRAIAPVVGASQKTVSRDLRTESHDSVEDDHEPAAKITGLNGKTYQRPEPSRWQCTRCHREFRRQDQQPQAGGFCRDCHRARIEAEADERDQREQVKAAENMASGLIEAIALLSRINDGIAARYLAAVAEHAHPAQLTLVGGVFDRQVLDRAARGVAALSKEMMP